MDLKTKANHEKNVSEIIEIIRAVGRHLAEPDGCSHSIDFIVKEALPSESLGAGEAPRPGQLAQSLMGMKQNDYCREIRQAT